MTKKKLSEAPTAAPNLEAIAAAIAEGKALIADGKSKVEASMAIYVLIENESQETIVKAFVEGASLTEKGALTYWYNCRRKVKKQKLLSAAKTARDGDQ